MGRVVTQAAEVATVIADAPKRPPCKRVLMASPKYFAVESAINPWMKDKSGTLNEVNPRMAMQQWNIMRDSYTRIGVSVSIVNAPAGLPDFCFAANQSVTFSDDDHDAVIMARMASPTRRDEVAHFERWYVTQGFRIHHLPDGIARFEGTGDAVIHPGRRLFWGGIGPRSEEAAWSEIARITGQDVIPLRLADEHFYHLDTCFCALDETSAMYVPAAFDDASRELIEAAFENLHVISEADAANFACNAHCPDGSYVLIQEGSQATVEWLRMHNFKVAELDTSEFMKSGGSVFCLKQELP